MNLSQTTNRLSIALLAATLVAPAALANEALSNRRSLANRNMLQYQAEGGITGMVRTLSVQWNGLARAERKLSGHLLAEKAVLDRAEVQSLAQDLRAFFADLPDNGQSGSYGADIESYDLQFNGVRPARWRGLMQDQLGADLRDRLNALWADLISGERAGSNVLVEVSVDEADPDGAGITILKSGKWKRWTRRAGIRAVLRQGQLSADDMAALESLDLSAVREGPYSELPDVVIRKFRGEGMSIHEQTGVPLAAEGENPWSELPLQVRKFRGEGMSIHGQTGVPLAGGGPWSELPLQVRKFRGEGASIYGQAQQLNADRMGPYSELPDVVIRKFRGEGMSIHDQTGVPVAAEGENPWSELPLQVRKFRGEGMSIHDQTGVPLAGGGPWSELPLRIRKFRGEAAGIHGQVQHLDAAECSHCSELPQVRIRRFRGEGAGITEQTGVMLPFEGKGIHEETPEVVVGQFQGEGTSYRSKKLFRRSFEGEGPYSELPAVRIGKAKAVGQSVFAQNPKKALEDEPKASITIRVFEQSDNNTASRQKMNPIALRSARKQFLTSLFAQLMN